jgi:hypothetical protein
MEDPCQKGLDYRDKSIMPTDTSEKGLETLILKRFRK